MDMYDFVCFIGDFRIHPPMHEIARCWILLPGDKGYKGDEVTPEMKRRGLKNVVRPAGKAPDWFKRGAEKLKGLMSGDQRKHGR